MKKRWIATILAVTMLMTMPVSVPDMTQDGAFSTQMTALGATTTANGVEKDTNADGVSDTGFVYTITGTTATITSYQGTATALTVPTRIEASGTGTITAGTYDVTAIGSAAFAGNAGLVSVTMQGAATSGSGSSSSTANAAVGLQTIGERAFFGCPTLTTVTIPATVTSIGSLAFSDCPALSSLNVTAGNQRYISNDGVLYEYIGYSSGATGSYNTYTLMQYPSGKTGTAYSVPAAIAGRLASVGQGAFAGAQSLTSVTLPETVGYIGVEAFRGCTSLTSIAIPSQVTSIPAYAFSGCTKLETVTIPEGVSSIGDFAFQNCASLTAITLPEKLTAINTGTFFGCSKLSELTVFSNVKSIGATAFAYCTSLVKITIPSSVTSIGANAFLAVNGLTMYCHSGSAAATYASSNKIGAVMTYTVRFLSDTNNLLKSEEVVYGSAATAPVMAERPGYQLVWSSDFSNISSDLTVTASYKRVYTVTFVDGYRDKSATAQVEYGNAAKAPKWTMSGYTLRWDKSFSAVTGDMTVYAIWKDPKTGFTINKNTKKPAKVDTELTKGTVTYRVTAANVQNPKVTYVSNSNATARTITIPKAVTIKGVKYKVTGIGEEAFKGNKTITTLTIGANVTTIGDKAFQNCKKLSTVKINTKNLSTIGEKAFYGIKNNATFSAYRSKLIAYQSKIKSSGINTTIRLRAIG